MKRALKKFFLTNEKFYSIMVTMRNYISMGPNYQCHFTCEEDRSWLEETLINHKYATSDTAIEMNQTCNENDNRFKFSLIGSSKATSENILWIAQRMMRDKGILTITAIAIHPNFRTQNYIRNIGEDYLNWIKIDNRWNAQYLQILTGSVFSAGRDLFGGPWTEVVHDGMKTSTIRIEDL